MQVGDGLTMGGAMVVGRGTCGVVWQHLERGIGDIADPQTVLAHAKEAAAKAAAKA